MWKDQGGQLGDVILQLHTAESLIDGSSNRDGLEGTDRRNMKRAEMKEVGITVRKEQKGLCRCLRSLDSAILQDGRLAEVALWVRKETNRIRSWLKPVPKAATFQVMRSLP